MAEDLMPFSIAGGDTNLSAPKLRERIVQHVAGRLLPGAVVDHVIVTGQDCEVVNKIDLGKQGSDNHHAWLYVLDVYPYGRKQRGRHPAVRIKVLIWNPYVGQEPDVVRARLAVMVDRWLPDFVLLSEAYRLHAVLRQIRGFEVQHGRPGKRGTVESERADCAVMVSTRHEVIARDTARMRLWWSYNVKKGPRRYPWVKVQIKDSDLVVRAMSVHFPWGEARNRNTAAIAESVTRTRLWLGRPAKFRHKAR